MEDQDLTILDSAIAVQARIAARDLRDLVQVVLAPVVVQADLAAERPKARSLWSWIVTLS